MRNACGAYPLLCALCGSARIKNIQGNNIALNLNAELRRQVPRRHQHQLHPLSSLRQHRQRNLADPLVLPFPRQRPHPPRRDQSAQSAVSSAVGGIGEEGQPLGGLDPAADDGAQFQRPGLAMQPHHAGHRVHIGDPQRVIAQRPGLVGKVHSIRGPAQEGEAAGEAQLDERRAGGRGEAYRARHGGAWG